MDDPLRGAQREGVTADDGGGRGRTPAVEVVGPVEVATEEPQAVTTTAVTTVPMSAAAPRRMGRT